MKDVKKLLEVRAEMKKRKPHFKRHDRNKLGRLARSGWRKSVQGHDNKQRNRYAGNEKSPSPGYGAPRQVHSMHPCGMKEIIVHNVNDLGALDPKTIAVRVGGTVGNRKKIDIVEAAKKRNFKVLNPRYEVKEVKAPSADKKKEADKKSDAQAKIMSTESTSSSAKLKKPAEEKKAEEKKTDSAKESKTQAPKK